MLYRRTVKLMGNMFEIAICGNNAVHANRLIDTTIAEIKRIERLLTTFAEDSVTNQINQSAGIKAVHVPLEVFELIYRCQKIAELTQGAFDISYGGLDKRLWNFDMNMKKLPPVATAAASVRLINYKNIILDRQSLSIFLKVKGMRIGFGGIGKGYAADMATTLLKAHGTTSGFVNAAGDLKAWGNQEDGRPWTIGIADPNHAHKSFSAFNITDTAVATSGSYEKYVIIDGKRYSHTIDPQTGYPVSGVKSVTIITKSAELADALATPVMVMGTKPGLNLINQLKGVGCIIIDDADELHFSNNIIINQ